MDKQEKIIKVLMHVKQILEIIIPDEVEAVAEPIDPLKYFTDLRFLLNSGEWPTAVNPETIVDRSSDAEKTERAEGIIEVMNLPDMKELKFLDFGCGEGHVAKKVAETAKMAVGYDLKSNFIQDTTENLLFTTNFEEVAKSAPYDIILIYDVLDHCDDPISILNNCKSVLGPSGRVFVRCHPWCSRHGGHLYLESNHAFAHLVFTEEELQKMGLHVDCKQKVLFPGKTYSDWFNETNFKIDKSSVETTNVEGYFVQQLLVKNRILEIYRQKNGFPTKQLQQDFRDYVLVLPS